MRATCYLVFNYRGVDRSTKHAPTLGDGEFAVRLNVDVPNEFFKPTVATVDVQISPRDVIVPVVSVDGEPPRSQPSGEEERAAPPGDSETRP